MKERITSTERGLNTQPNPVDYNEERENQGARMGEEAKHYHVRSYKDSYKKLQKESYKDRRYKVESCKDRRVRGHKTEAVKKTGR